MSAFVAVAPPAARTVPSASTADVSMDQTVDIFPARLQTPGVWTGIGRASRRAIPLKSAKIAREWVMGLNTSGQQDIDRIPPAFTLVLTFIAGLLSFGLWKRALIGRPCNPDRSL